LKNRLIITVTDVHGTKSYDVHQFIKKFYLIISTMALLIIAGSFWIISILKDDITEVKIEKTESLLVLKYKNELELKKLRVNNESELELLEKKEKELLNLNDMYSTQIQNKVKDLDELSSKLGEIEELIGLKQADETTIIQRMALAKLTTAQKMFTLQSIPNGNPYLNTIIFATPISYYGRLIQYLGRVGRDGQKCLAIDFLDSQNAMLNSAYKKRKEGYKQMHYKLKRA